MKIAVVTNPKKDEKYIYTRLICSKLRLYEAEVIVPVQTAQLAPAIEATPVSLNELYTSSDVIVVLGGDGTILHAAKKAALSGVPVLGINIGTLGFMAGLEVDELDKLELLTQGKFNIDERMMLRIVFDSRPGTVYYALNEAVIARDTLSKIIDIDICCDSRRIGKYRADGIIVSTPTGSTAYSLSAGGPIVDPVLECMELTPICPHSFVSRTVMFSPTSQIGLKIQDLENKEAYLTIDGLNSIELKADERVTITKATQKAKIIRLKDLSFYEVLYNKFTERGV